MFYLVLLDCQYMCVMKKLKVQNILSSPHNIVPLLRNHNCYWFLTCLSNESIHV